MKDSIRVKPGSYKITDCEVIDIRGHRVEVPALVPGRRMPPLAGEEPIPYKPDWHAVAVALFLGVLGAVFALASMAIVTGCGGTQQVAQGAEKVAIQKSGESCDERAVAIIQAGETCEGIITALNRLVATDPKCANIFHASDPVVTCKGVGIQPRPVAR